MQNKRFAVIVSMLLALAMVLSACTAMPAAPAQPAADSGASGEAAAPASDIKIGLVTDVGRVNDRSFNQSAWEGVVQAATALGLTEGEGYKYIETQDPKDYADNIQQFVDAGFNVIVTVGFAMGDLVISLVLKKFQTLPAGIGGSPARVLVTVKSA